MYILYKNDENKKKIIIQKREKMSYKVYNDSNKS